jgi:hypothetical protein
MEMHCCVVVDGSPFDSRVLERNKDLVGLVAQMVASVLDTGEGRTENSTALF